MRMMSQPVHPPESTFPHSLSDRIAKGLLTFEEVLLNDTALASIKRQNRLISSFFCDNIQQLITKAFDLECTSVSNRAFQFINSGNTQITAAASNCPEIERAVAAIFDAQDRFQINRLAAFTQSCLTSFPAAINGYLAFVPRFVKYADESSVSTMFSSLLSPDPILSAIPNSLASRGFIAQVVKLAAENCDLYLGSSLYIILQNCARIHILKQQLTDPSILIQLTDVLLPTHTPQLSFATESQVWRLFSSILSPQTSGFLVSPFMTALSEIEFAASSLPNEGLPLSQPLHSQNETEISEKSPHDVGRNSDPTFNSNFDSVFDGFDHSFEHNLDSTSHSRGNDEMNAEKAEEHLSQPKVHLYYDTISQSEIPKLRENVCTAIHFASRFLEQNPKFSGVSDEVLQKSVQNTALLFSAYPDHSFALDSLTRFLFAALVSKTTEETVFQVFFPIMITAALQTKKTTLQAFAREFARKVRLLCGHDPHFDEKIGEETAFLALCNTEVYHDDVVIERNYGGFQKRLPVLRSTDFSLSIPVDA